MCNLKKHNDEYIGHKLTINSYEKKADLINNLKIEMKKWKKLKKLTLMVDRKSYPAHISNNIEKYPHVCTTLEYSNSDIFLENEQLTIFSTLI